MAEINNSVLYNDIYYSVSAQFALEEVLNTNLLSSNREQYNQCVLWYRSFIKGLTNLLSYPDKSCFDGSEITGVVVNPILHGEDISKVIYRMLRKNGRTLVFIQELSITTNHPSFPDMK